MIKKLNKYKTVKIASCIFLSSCLIFMNVSCESTPDVNSLETPEVAVEETNTEKDANSSINTNEDIILEKIDDEFILSEEEILGNESTQDTGNELNDDSETSNDFPPAEDENVANSSESEVISITSDNADNESSLPSTPASAENNQIDSFEKENQNKPIEKTEAEVLTVPGKETASLKNEDAKTSVEVAVEKTESPNATVHMNEEKTEEISSQNSSNKLEEEEEEDITPSRSVSMMNNQYLDIVYPGSGWIYLGELDEKTSMRYFGRKINAEDTAFILRSKEEGTTILHFYKNDALTGTYIDDYLEVIVSGTNKTGERITAPSYAETVPPKPNAVSKSENIHNEEKSVSTNTDSEASETTLTVEKADSIDKSEDLAQNTSQKVQSKQNVSQNEESVSTVIQTTENQSQQQNQTLSTAKGNSTEKTTVSPDLSAEELIELAYSSFNSKDYEGALDYLNSFFNIAVNRIDEGLYLQGQILEANSILRNIRAALDSYESLVKMYPQSEYWQKANERIIYLNRFYFNIR